jgi:3'-5' exoribonuclease
MKSPRRNEKMYVEQLKEMSKKNALIDGSYIISKLEAKQFRDKPGIFLTCDLIDKTGTIKAVVWDRADILKECLKNKCVFKITGEATRYKDSPQIVIKTAVKTETYDPADFMPSLDAATQKECLEYLKTIALFIKDPTCKKIWSYLITEPEDGDLEKFKTCPGGVGDAIHHSYLGGLLEHSTSMVKIAEHFCQDRPDLNKDILLTGCLIHDIGKIVTYDWSTVIEMTDAGRLLHHTTLGVGILNCMIGDEDDDTGLQLAHIIVSHHQEEGIRKPMTPEAEAVAQIDSLDAAIKGIQQYESDPANKQEDGGWTKFCNLTGRQYFLGGNKEDVIDIPISEPKKMIAPGIVEEHLFQEE